jgi:hypothetical protein
MTQHPAIEAMRAQLWNEWTTASEALRAVPGVASGPLNATPDAVRATLAYRQARAASDRAFRALRVFNDANPPPPRGTL